MRLSHVAGLGLALMLLGSSDPALAAAGLRSPQGPHPPQEQMAEPRPGQQGRASRGRQQRRSSVGLAIESISPSSAAPTSKISLSGSVTNQTNQPINGMSVRLRFSQRAVASRAELEQQAGTRPPPLSAQTTNPQQFRQPLASGAKQGWRLNTTARELGFTSFGVYPLSVEVYDAAGRSLAAQRTFLTFVPKDYKKQLKPTKIAWVWPLIDAPHRTVGPKFRDDRLAADFAPGGRLNGLVAAARAAEMPLTWAIDPALVDDARTMTQPYTLLKSGSVEGTQKPKSDAAAQWLADVKSATAGDPYFATPYADPDVVALVRQRRTGDLRYAYSPDSIKPVRDALGRQPEPMAWPPEGAAGQETLSQLSRNLKQVNRTGSQTFLLSSNVLPGSTSYTPSAAIRTTQGSNYVVAADQTISSVIGGNTRTPGTAVLAEQRFLAETAMITAEQPNVQRTVVVVPPRRWNPNPQFAERLLSDTTTTARWLQPVALRDVTAAPTKDRAFAGYPSGYQTHELNARYLKSVRSIQTRALRFADIFQPRLTGYEHGVLRAESSAWRGRRAAARGRAARDALANEVKADVKKVHFVLNKEGPSLAGEAGQVPVTIANDMADHSITVYLEVTSKYPGKLRIGEFTRKVTIRSNEKATVQIPMKALANGKTDVRLLLRSERGREIGVVRQIRVNATSFGRTAYLITGSALVVLFLGVGVRMMRARRRNGNGAASPGAQADVDAPADVYPAGQN